LQNFAQFILALAWSFSFLNTLTEAIFARFERAVRWLGNEVDFHLAGQTEQRGSMRRKCDMLWIHTREGTEPHLLMELPGMVPIYKPTDWEVDGAVIEGDDHPPLSAYMQSIFSAPKFPLLWDAE